MLAGLMFSNKQKKQIYYDALPIISTYLSSPGRQLEAQYFGVDYTSSFDNVEFERFVNYIRLRHLLFIGTQITTVVYKIEEFPSKRHNLRRVNQLGSIRGKLDVPRYVQRRIQNQNIPRQYPVVVREDAFDTPENILVTYTLMVIQSELQAIKITKNTDLDDKKKRLRQLIVNILRRQPWNKLIKQADIKTHIWLLDALKKRLRKFQTGNQQGYQQFLSVFEMWQKNISYLNPKHDIVENLLSGLLFADDFAYWDKMFEIWCLNRIINGLDRLGFKYDEQKYPQPTEFRSQSPIYQLTNQDLIDVNIYFQRQSGLLVSTWTYDNGVALRGIPDLLITDLTDVPLVLIDVKNRKIGSTKSESEEIYKMLGYLENFRSTYTTKKYIACLIFFNDKTPISYKIISPHGELLVISVAPVSKDEVNSEQFGVIANFIHENLP
ncbi:MAG: hypothetical protein Phog2KO_39240 [Phototrophicaceae bacterium]